MVLNVSYYIYNMEAFLQKGEVNTQRRVCWSKYRCCTFICCRSSPYNRYDYGNYSAYTCTLFHPQQPCRTYMRSSLHQARHTIRNVIPRGISYSLENILDIIYLIAIRLSLRQPFCSFKKFLLFCNIFIDPLSNIQKGSESYGKQRAVVRGNSLR